MTAYTDLKMLCAGAANDRFPPTLTDKYVPGAVLENSVQTELPQPNLPKYQ
ncbi:MAG: hypothetical protein ACRBBO_15065 [Cognatishimia sp.]